VVVIFIPGGNDSLTLKSIKVQSFLGFDEVNSGDENLCVDFVKSMYSTIVFSTFKSQ